MPTDQTPSTPPPAPALPAASVLLLREGPDGIEVLAFQRHGGHRAFAGMLAFPGGKVMDSDHDPAVRDLADGAGDLSDEALGYRATGVRELFEETGVLLARDRSGQLVDGVRARALWPLREPLDKGDLPLAQFLEAEGLRLACDLMEPYSNWVTPAFRPKRFDTHFLIAPAPDGQEIHHPGTEADEVFWVRPRDILAEVDAYRRRMMFTTYSNLTMLRDCRTVKEAQAVARALPKMPVSPVRVSTDGGLRVRIPAESGYRITEMPAEIGGENGVSAMELDKLR